MTLQTKIVTFVKVTCDNCFLVARDDETGVWHYLDDGDHHDDPRIALWMIPNHTLDSWWEKDGQHRCPDCKPEVAPCPDCKPEATP